MMIRSLRQHWPSRKTEWLMAGFLATWGIYVLLNPSLFSNPATGVLYAGLTAVSGYFTAYPALFWGGAAFLIGLCRAVALFVNGAYTRTPLVRVVASFLSMFILTQVLIGLWKSGVPNTGIIVYAWLVVADLLSAYRAAVDVVYAEKHRHDVRESSRAASDFRLAA